MIRIGLALSLALVSCRSGDDRRAAPAASANAPRDAVVAIGDAAPPKDLAGELEAIRAQHRLPALAAAVWRDGTLVEEAAVGLRKSDDPASKVTLADAWHLGSNTKAMTALLVGIYVDRGKLRWNDTLAQLLPGEKLDKGYAQVTLDQLLRHEGGAPGEPPDELWKQLWTDGTAKDARIKFVRGILARPPAQAPGTFEYSNAGYMIAGIALERAAGATWEQLARDELFAKLGMRSCGFGAPGVKDRVDQPWGHDAGGTPISPGLAGDNPPGVGPAGTVHCALADYGKFLALYATGAGDLVTPETLQHLQTARSFGYAGGWMVVTNPGGTLLVHSGSNTLWYATAIVAPAHKLALAIVTNKGDGAIEGSLERLLARHVKTR